MIKYTFTLLFPKSIEKDQVTVVNFQVTGEPAIQPPLQQNQMPATIAVNDTLTFTYHKANKDVKIDSCLLTQYNTDSSQKGGSEDFINKFDKPITIPESFVGSWVFHLLGMYKVNNKHAAYYLDPEATFRP
jgi:hypothetical protein